jgi:serpin B
MMAVSFQDSHELAQAVDSVNSFGIAIYRELAAEQPGQSFFFSPSSIAFALAMTLQGAAGETANELAQALCGDCRPEVFHKAMAFLYQSTFSSSVDLCLANRLWGKTGYEFVPTFLEATERYGARLAEVDFENDAEAARATINSWVSEQTRGKINELLASGSIQELTRLIVTNAVYFLGVWSNSFDERRTAEAAFWMTPTDFAQIPLMSQQGVFGYGEVGDLQTLAMSYVESEMPPGPYRPEIARSNLSMCVLLPRQRDSLATIEAELTNAKLRECLPTSFRRVSVSFPKFRVRSGKFLRDTLEKLGVRTAFDRDTADFRNATKHPEGLFVDEIIHQAFVSVDEQGTEASAATAVYCRGGGFYKPPEETKTFRADHPFLFLIRDDATKLIHFMGRFTGV